jgi:hypothetical protein
VGRDRAFRSNLYPRTLRVADKGFPLQSLAQGQCAPACPACGRQVFAEIYQMLKKGEYHYGRDLLNHTGKMKEYQRFLEGQKKHADLKNTA